MITIPYIHTADGITLFFDNENLPISRSDPDFRKIQALLNDPYAQTYQLREAVAPVRDRLLKVVAAHEKDGFTFENGVIKRNGLALNAFLTAKVEKMVDENWDLKPIAAFLDNLALNPSYRVVNDLYAFLEYGQMPITPDGYFLAYKYVSSTLMDCASGTFDNSPGKTCSMPRNQVDENPDNTCSRGLHVCSFSYLPAFGNGSGTRIVVVKVHPKDVVAIPRDYNNTKMRVSDYLVLNEITQRPQERADVLAQRAVFNDTANFNADYDALDPDRDYEEEYDDASYTVRGRKSASDPFEDIDQFGDLDEAKEAAYDEFRDYREIRIVNDDTCAVVLQLSTLS